MADAQVLTDTVRAVPRPGEEAVRRISDGIARIVLLGIQLRQEGL